MKQAIKRWRDTSPLMEPVCRALRLTGILPERVWQHLAFTGTVDFKVAGRKVLMAHFGAQIENTLFWAGYGSGWEATTLLVWERLACQSSTVFDVGANTGLFALAAKAANPHARVHAFEPLPAIVSRLNRNIALNGWEIAVHAAAVSDREGTAQIRLAMADHEYSASFEHMEWMDSTPVQTIDVPLVTLSGIMAQTGDVPDLIKLDVERHEPQALAGMWSGLDPARLPVMVVEILDDGCAAAVGEQLAGRGYRCFVIREGQSISEEPLRFVPGTMNWLMVPATAGGFCAELLGAGRIGHEALLRGRPGA